MFEDSYSELIIRYYRIFCFTYEILSGLSYNGFWSGHEKVGSGWRWLDGNQHNVTFWKSGHSKLDGRHVVVKKCGEWVSVDNETCAEAVCIIRGLLIVISKF